MDHIDMQCNDSNISWAFFTRPPQNSCISLVGVTKWEIDRRMIVPFGRRPVGWFSSRHHHHSAIGLLVRSGPEIYLENSIIETSLLVGTNESWFTKMQHAFYRLWPCFSICADHLTKHWQLMSFGCLLGWCPTSIQKWRCWSLPWCKAKSTLIIYDPC